MSKTAKKQAVRGKASGKPQSKPRKSQKLSKQSPANAVKQQAISGKASSKPQSKPRRQSPAAPSTRSTRSPRPPARHSRKSGNLQTAKLPKGWKMMCLGEMYDISAGGDFNPNKSSATKDNEYLHPVYSNALTNKGLYGYSIFSKHEADAITITARGDIGYAFHRKTNFVAIGRLLVLNKKIPISNEFVYSYINHCVKFHKETTGVPQLTVPQISTYSVAFPPLPEQKAIADTLSLWDEAIEKTQHLVEKYKAKKRGLMQKLLTGKWRTRPHSRHSRKSGNPQTAKLPKGWGEAVLQDACDIYVSPVDKKIITNEKKVCLCNYMDVYYNSQISARIKFMAGTATHQEIEKFSLFKGDVIITKDSETPEDIGVPAYVAETIKNLLCGYHLAILRPREEIIGEYLYYALLSPKVKYEFFKYANGITRFALTADSYKKIRIPIPLPPEQKAIADTLSLWDEAIEKTQHLLQKYKAQKHGLMQKLFTGEWRAFVPPTAQKRGKKQGKTKNG